MNQYHNLQIRYSADSVEPGVSIFFRGSQYTLGHSIPKTLQPSALPIGVIMNGYTEQFQLTQGNLPVGAAWFYFYGSVEGSSWAILDEVELELTASIGA